MESFTKEQVSAIIEEISNKYFEDDNIDFLTAMDRIHSELVEYFKPTEK
jgi:hypothetical protein